jgi:hypothetical protein
LSEVIVPTQDAGSNSTSSETEGTAEPPTAAPDTNPVESNKQEKSEGGLLGSLKSLYDKADTMAASQALLLNKQLEDAGIIEKITDETGLKVIGREEAAKIKDKKEDGQN